MRIFETPLAPQSGLGRVVFGVLVAVLATAALLAWTPANADDSEARKAESPYFQVASSDPSLDRLPLKATRVDVRIAGVIADVTVTQHYRNEGQRAIEARYVFPGSTSSAVYALNVRLGERLLVAKIREKQQARIEYETAKQEGKTTALLEQHRPNVFEMNVANILPGDDVAVELRYTELVTPHDAVYGFVFPTVVGPRYNSPQGAGAGERWVATPHLPAGVPSASAFEIKVVLDTPVPVKEIASRSHDVRIDGGDGSPATVTLEARRRRQRPRLPARLPPRRRPRRAGLMLFRGETEGFFLALVEPPKAVPVAQISPRDYIFVVDISGSMHGYPLETSKALLEKLIGALRPSDTFNVMLFSGSNRMLAPASVPATRANIDRALQTIREMGGGGSTEIVPALRARRRAAEGTRRVAQRHRRHRRLRHGRERGVPARAQEPRPGQRVRLRHRHQRQPAPDRRPGARRPGRGVHRHQAGGSGGAGRAAAQDDRQPRADPGEGALRGPRHLRRPAGAAARPAWRPAGRRLRQVPRRAAAGCARSSSKDAPPRARGAAKPAPPAATTRARRRCATCGRGNGSRCSPTRKRSKAATRRRKRSPRSACSTAC